MNVIESLHLVAGWWGVTLGAFSGALMGLLFHRKDWLGGYGSRERRMVLAGAITMPLVCSLSPPGESPCAISFPARSPKSRGDQPL